jgi:hypothetical protein
MTKQEIHEMCEQYGDEGVIILDGFESAFIGVVGNGQGIPRACYDRSKVIEHLATAMSYEESVEYFEFNVNGACLGDNSPMFIDLA